MFYAISMINGNLISGTKHATHLTFKDAFFTFSN
jgi:hypothetical protein